MNAENIKKTPSRGRPFIIHHFYGCLWLIGERFQVIHTLMDNGKNFNIAIMSSIEDQMLPFRETQIPGFDICTGLA